MLIIVGFHAEKPQVSAVREASMCYNTNKTSYWALFRISFIFFVGSQDAAKVDENSSSCVPHYGYSIKAVNPLCMSQYKTIKVSENPPAFTSVDKPSTFQHHVIFLQWK